MEGSSLWKTISLALSIPQWPAVFGLWLRSLKLSPFHISMFFGVSLFRSYLGIHVDEASYGEPF